MRSGELSRASLQNIPKTQRSRKTVKWMIHHTPITYIPLSSTRPMNVWSSCFRQPSTCPRQPSTCPSSYQSISLRYFKGNERHHDSLPQIRERVSPKNKTFSYRAMRSLPYPTNLAVILRLHLVSCALSWFSTCPQNILLKGRVQLRV